VTELEQRDRIWQRPYIEHRRKEVRDTLAKSPSTKLKKPPRSLDELSFSELLDAFLFATELASSGRFSASSAKDLIDGASNILEHLKLHRGRSKLDYLHRELYLLRSRISKSEGDAWGAYWLERLSDEKKPSPENELREFLPTLKGVSSDEFLYNPEAALEMQIEQIEQLRWTGRADEANFLLDALPTSNSLSKSLSSKITWLRSSLCLQLLQSERSLREAERVAMVEDRPDYLMEIHLWALCLSSKKAIRWPSELTRGDGPLFQFVRTLENAYHNDIPLRLRIERVGLACGLLARDVPHSTFALAWASVARWLLRSKRKALSDDYLFLYQTLSSEMSGSVTADILGIFNKSEPNRTMLTKLPTSQMQRWSQVGKIASGVCQMGAKYLITSPFRSRSDNLKETERLQATFSQIIYRYGDQMKGGWMKVGQLASYLGPDLNSDARRVLARLQQDSSPLDSVLIESIIKRELGKSVTTLFDYWNPEPLATGSVGQVHRARLSNGEEVVVKVQYPEIHSILTRDLQSLSFLIPLVRPFFRHWDFNSLLAEVRKHFLEECDYLQEGKNQADFRNIFSTDKEIIIPRVYSDLSTAKILTSQHIPGRRFKEFAASASEKERNFAAEVMTRWHWTSIFKAKVFSGDPHPGNFIFLPKQVAFIDFGNVKRWGSSSCDGIRFIMEGFLNDDFDQVARGYALAEMTSGQNNVIREEFSKIRKHVLGYLREDRPIEFDHDKALDYFRSCTTANPNTRHTIKITSECALLFKAHWSFFATLGQLRPTVNWRQIYLRSTQ
jgi:predicted unusual protein kinase regulating ubiquinone biosynthesis (AarF/ABC1/UbiB family)